MCVTRLLLISTKRLSGVSGTLYGTKEKRMRAKHKDVKNCRYNPAKVEKDGDSEDRTPGLADANGTLYH